MSDQARIDKWLWAVRIYKTRSIAAEACKKGHIMVRDKAVKPAFTIREGDIVQVKKSPITYSFKVLKCAENRVGAKLVPELMENVTPQEQYELLEMSRISGFIDRARGTGRPTKKERRDMDSFMDDASDFEFDEFDFDD
ncbi:MAG: RNA-binding S4 domain-containing protein [Bacteroidaceae bacterium]|nr:RNA-binding S4 domain-containing protein [Bacteroidaceae bacterium]MBQ8735150.1 RNA-binding S4 domain-containing protein [Bacteroidaceae bacterium]